MRIFLYAVFIPYLTTNINKALNMECADFYIHIDKKVDITNFKKRLSKYNNVFFLPDSMRVKVYWGGMSQVVMQYNMIKEMMESKINYVNFSCP